MKKTDFDRFSKYVQKYGDPTKRPSDIQLLTLAKAIKTLAYLTYSSWLVASLTAIAIGCFVADRGLEYLSTGPGIGMTVMLTVMVALTLLFDKGHKNGMRLWKKNCPCLVCERDRAAKGN